MIKKQAYSYTVLRYVHDIVAGEALNVGVVIHAPDSSFFGAETRKAVRRLKHAFPDLDRDEFRKAMEAIDRGAKDVARQAGLTSLFDGGTDAGTHANKILPRDDSALQWSSVGTGLTSDPKKTLRRLYKRYVTQYDDRPEQQNRRTDRRRNNEDIWRPLNETLMARGINIPFRPKVVKGDQDKVEFKRAWKNGDWRAYEPLSLDFAKPDDIKDKARRWRGHLSAAAVGETETVKVHFILGRPQDASLISDYEAAKVILKGARCEPKIVDENDMEEFASDLALEYENHLNGDRRPAAS